MKIKLKAQPATSSERQKFVNCVKFAGHGSHLYLHLGEMPVYTPQEIEIEITPVLSKREQVEQLLRNFGTPDVKAIAVRVEAIYRD